MMINEYGHAQLEQRINQLEQARQAYRASRSDDDKRVYELVAFELADFVFWNRDKIFYLYDESAPDGSTAAPAPNGSTGSEG